MLGLRILWDRRGWGSKDQVTISDPATVQVSFRHNFVTPVCVLASQFYSVFVSAIRGTSLCCIYLNCEPLDGQFFISVYRNMGKKENPHFCFFRLFFLVFFFLTVEL